MVPHIHRRTFFKDTLLAGSALLVGCSDAHRPSRSTTPRFQPEEMLPGGEYLGTISFLREAVVPINTKFDLGLDGRLCTDLSTLTSSSLITPTENYFIRTLNPDRLPHESEWKIEATGLIRTPTTISLSDLKSRVRPQGTHLMECAGNAFTGRFGLMSAAKWEGVPVSEILETLPIEPAATRVLFSGFDEHSTSSNRNTSMPGAGWVFTFDELASAGAFLATKMNGEPLTPDHGFPVRLFVPGSYGCTSVKWLNEIRFVDESVPTTSQMREFSSRTHQDGIPQRARNYQPAVMQQSAMPIRIEKWLVDSKIVYRVVGILWGGQRPTNSLLIRFLSYSDKGKRQPVDHCPLPKNNRTWALWSHLWRPKKKGKYQIVMSIDEPDIPTKRLDENHYLLNVILYDI